MERKDIIIQLLNEWEDEGLKDNELARLIQVMEQELLSIKSAMTSRIIESIATLK